MSNLKYKLEALLFSSARSMTIEELCKLAKASPEEVREKLNELKKDYEEKDSSIALMDEGNAFKLNIKPEHVGVVQQIVMETELSKTLMETLAVIAFKYPIKQSDLIKIRTNKAYDHLRVLEEMDYISRQKFGRTKLIKLTPKFFEYFDLPPEKLKDKFTGFEGIAKAIKEKEGEIKKIKEEMKQKAKEAKKEVDLIDEKGHKKKLEVFEEAKEVEKEEKEQVEPYTDKVGELEVVDVEEKEEGSKGVGEETDEERKGIEMREELGEEGVEKEEEKVEESDEKTLKDVDSEVDKRVEELLHPKEKNEEEPSEEEEKANS